VGSSQTKDYKIGICCLSAKQAALRERPFNLKGGILKKNILIPNVAETNILILVFHSILCRFLSAFLKIY
jgi:hypothetical protein